MTSSSPDHVYFIFKKVRNSNSRNSVHKGGFPLIFLSKRQDGLKNVWTLARYPPFLDFNTDPIRPSQFPAKEAWTLPHFSIGFMSCQWLHIRKRKI